MGRRLLASLIDYCVIVGWLAVLAAVFVPLYSNDIRVPGPIDVIAFAASVLPVWLYLTVTEACAAHATWGKRRLGLHVHPAGPGRIAARNAVKLLPWQLGHLGVVAVAAGDGVGTLVSPALAWLPLSACYLIAGLSVALAFIRKDHAALHDLVAGTRVTADARTAGWPRDRVAVAEDHVDATGRRG